MKFTSERISLATGPFEFSVEIPFRLRQQVSRDLYKFISAVIARNELVQETAVVWINWREQVVWDKDGGSWHTEKVYRGLTFSDQVTYPSSYVEAIGKLRFNTAIWQSAVVKGAK